MWAFKISLWLKKIKAIVNSSYDSGSQWDLLNSNSSVVSQRPEMNGRSFSSFPGTSVASEYSIGPVYSNSKKLSLFFIMEKNTGSIFHIDITESREVHSAIPTRPGERVLSKVTLNISSHLWQQSCSWLTSWKAGRWMFMV